MAVQIDGRMIAEDIKRTVMEKVRELREVSGRSPKLVSVLSRAGHDARIYVNMQEKAASGIGIDFESAEYPEDISQRDLAAEIRRLNGDPSVSSLIIQKPLSPGIDHDALLGEISPLKDAEGIHPCNMGRILRRDADILPCTPGAVMKIFDHEGIDLRGREAVVVGHSDIVGKPLCLMLLNEMATATICHIATADAGRLEDHVRRAEILIVAVGKPRVVPGEWIRKGAFVVDVGINKVGSDIVGDVEQDSASSRAGYITPVPGGVGPVTVAILMRNVMKGFMAQLDAAA